ncbi:Na/Pi cotransporter family protein [Robiginitalea aurantiaca]|uniref:Na/Pi symporter n=1 Tax=Robiginitalea aurantiaca TaxID=3056915 RepID=A0ABT7WAV4_9FLAO|nr:Na/Pi symporter [Robiginitalea aurantiaca]MDM9630051.1 Na/Pi symporter [Robiginitalea aurantiaca]
MTYGFTDILQLVGALGLFLFGMKAMSDALTKLAGDRMRSILAGLTSNRFFGVLTGFLITSVIQSSSATTLMVVSFANASLLTLTESLSVIMGANIGTTITAWLITLLGFKVSMSSIALPLVGLGVGLTFFKNKNWEYWGSFIVGFGLLFIGLEFLKENMPDIEKTPEVLSFLQRYTQHGIGSVLLFLLVGTVLTVLIQSSSATMALTLLMAAKGWIPFEAAAAMVLGENIGTTITANIAAMVGNFRAKQTALAHLLFNVLGVLWMLAVFYPFLQGVAWVTERLGSGSPYTDQAAVPVGIALFHTFFNVANTFVMIWFINPMAKLVSLIVPEKVQPERPMEEPKFLSNEALNYPETALVALERETRYLFEHAVFEIVAHALSLHRKDILSERKPKKVVHKSREDLQVDVRELYLIKVKRIYSEIIAFAVHAQSDLELSESQHQRISELKNANRKIVEIIRDSNELSRNVNHYLREPHQVMLNEYDGFRKKMVKVFRVIQGYREDADRNEYQRKLAKLSEQALESRREGNLGIDKLIRKNKITPEMASSLVNDHDNLNSIIENLVEVAVILYGDQEDTALTGTGMQEPYSSALPL